MKRRAQYSSNPLQRNTRAVRSDNLVLIPASQLPFREHWGKIAQGLPAREALVVIPDAETRLKQVARALVPQLRAKGRHVTAVRGGRSRLTLEPPEAAR